MSIARRWLPGDAGDGVDDDEARQGRRDAHLARVGLMTAGVAHDFNNIISAISMYTELLERHQRFDDAGREHVHAILQQVDRAHVLVWRILDSANRTPLELVDVELCDFLAGLGPVLRRSLPDDVGISVVEEGGPHVVRGDPTGLQQILLNLATNASAAFDGPGTFSIRVRSAHRPKGEVGDLPEGHRWVRLDVTDTGRGMPPEVLARAGEPFFTTKPRGSGTGLGLSQVHGLVAQHHGHIVIRSSPGEGTAVSIWLRCPRRARP